MKKNLFYYLFAVICSVSLFTSCSDDDDEKVVCPVGETTFTDKSGLQLTYSSAPMLGKMVQFVPQGNKAVLTPYLVLRWIYRVCKEMRCLLRAA